ncbi:unnamed protein product [Rangifer tarandus platyrhynchus]|uniref:Uncharacterized protein n=2 Tax=Rangifer tarandus platyrhynchus TaxID=3082113 RepID=A0ACB0E0D8_RANTA|nr:unnamed protein product [Rangifer tarandus platyrhynchus]CAI9693914.1 unnamed protein product [Rangifer tarandus platyrhynchus]
MRRDSRSAPAAVSGNTRNMLEGSGNAQIPSAHRGGPARLRDTRTERSFFPVYRTRLERKEPWEAAHWGEPRGWPHRRAAGPRGRRHGGERGGPQPGSGRRVLREDKGSQREAGQGARGAASGRRRRVQTRAGRGRQLPAGGGGSGCGLGPRPDG